MTDRPRAAFHTLGCKVNQYDTDQVAGMFAARGYEIVPFDSKAEVYVINTCTVTHAGDRKSRQVIRRAARNNPEAVIAVMGCYAQVAPDEVAEIEGVDILIGTAQRKQLVDLVEEARKRRDGRTVCRVGVASGIEEFDSSATRYSGRTRATVKIQEGCDQFCSYCIVPYARGRSRSRTPDSILQEVRKLAERGYKEVVLTGIHLGGYGKDLAGATLASLMAGIHGVSGIERIRLSSIDCHEIDSELISIFADLPKVCRHLHIPLQSGDDEILRMMRRRYTTEDFRATVAAVRQRIPEVGITTDVIVGFPGETIRHFQNTLRFIEEVGFSRLHVFTYSRRKGTPASEMPGQVPAAEKTRRSKELISLGLDLAAVFHQKQVGRTVEVLAEQWNAEGGVCEGLTDNYVRVTFPCSQDTGGELVNVFVESADAEGVYGKTVGR